MSRTQIKIVLAEAVTVGPNDRLIVRVPLDAGYDREIVDGLMEEFDRIGLGERVLVLFADQLEFAKVEGVD